METLVNKIVDNNKSIFLKDVGKILAVQIVFQICLSTLFYLFPPYFNITPVQYFNYSAYFFIFVICATTLKYSLANRVLVYLFAIEFFYLGIFQIIPIYVYILYNMQFILTAAIPLLITLYLFFYSMAPNDKKQKKPVTFAIALLLIIVLVTYSNVDFLADYSNFDEEMRNITLNNLLLDSYYINLINLSFLLFVWFTYNQGQYLLSEYLPAILSVHTLLIINEVYQLYNYNHLMYAFIDGQYFNAVINTGFIIVWFIRLNYLSDPESKKGEYFVINYDMLSGYVEKPPNELWDAILTKLGKQKLFFGSIILFGIICVPLILIGDINFFSRFNIILMLTFLVAVMIYAIVYTQRKWFNHVGFLIKEQKK